MKSGKSTSKADTKLHDFKKSKTTVKNKEGGNKMEEELRMMVTQLIEKNKTNEIKNDKLTKDMNSMMDLMKKTIKELKGMTIEDEATEIKEHTKEDTKEDAKPIPMPSTPISVHAHTVKEPKKSFESVDVK